MTLTFEAFQDTATEYHVSEGARMLRIPVPEEYFEGTATILIYDGDFYIERLTDGQYCLSDDRSLVFFTDRERAERHLFDHVYLPEIAQ